MKKKVLVLFGGASGEHDVSLISAHSVIKNIPKDKYDIVPMGITKDGRWYVYSGDISRLPDDNWLNDKNDLQSAIISCDTSHHGILRFTENGVVIERIDVIFPVLHGKNGEDGTVQGLFELSRIPYVGCNTISSANCMDKAVTNALADFAGIPQAKWSAFNKFEYAESKALLLESAAKKLGFPIFVKPANAGSSVGISKAKNLAELEKACENAFMHDDKLVLEESVVGAEVECAVLGNEHPIASLVGEVVPCNEFYDYEAKYLAAESELHIPARLTKEKTDEVKAAAVKAYLTLGCSGLSRVDFFVRKSDGMVMLNEINTMPGFTSISMYPKLFAASGLPYSELLDSVIRYAFEK